MTETENVKRNREEVKSLKRTLIVMEDTIKDLTEQRDKYERQYNVVNIQVEREQMINNVVMKKVGNNQTLTGDDMTEDTRGTEQRKTEEKQGRKKQK